eukprot:6474063-Amphidinium_carterae.1
MLRKHNSPEPSQCNYLHNVASGQALKQRCHVHNSCQTEDDIVTRPSSRTASQQLLKPHRSCNERPGAVDGDCGRPGRDESSHN